MKRIALAISLIGILILIFLVNNYDPEMTPIKEIKSLDTSNNQIVKINGIIINKKTYKNNFTILTLEDSNKDKIEVICNCPEINYENIIVTGRLGSYEGKPQIIAEKIERL